ncbi:amidohydrolase [Algoriphagus sp.]|uniref:amidohydrolase n=1 Tax=Algoriphagus sp. TaxID=1872435 RepID=UPI0025D7FFDE|nr:amidohydrolase [Algoriphagus sp.]
MSRSPHLTIALIQTSLFWKDKTSNLAMLEEKIWEIKEPVDLIILPEMFPTGFSMDASELAEPMNLLICKWMKQMAAQTKAVITGSAIISERGQFFNRLLWVTPEGKVSYYDKRHLFRMAKEDETFTPGQKFAVFTLNGWKICPQVCYDLRFPVFSRNTWKGEEAAYDFMFFVASWPAVRTSAWDALLPARAIENLCYVAGVNRVGKDGNGIDYVGHSGVFDFKGNDLSQTEKEIEKIEIFHLEAASLESYRKKFPAWMDADAFTIR